MKTTELSINDLVRLKNEYYEMPEGTVMRVAEVYTESAYCQDMNNEFEPLEIPDYMLDPIPLTDKVFKKNNFEKRGCGWYIPYTSRLDLGILAFGIDDGCGIGFSQMPNGDFVFFAKYFHELQHALRLCEIKNNIEP